MGNGYTPGLTVAETSLPGEVKPINVAARLGIAPEELPQAMLKKRAGLLASMNGATQIQAGVIRPQLIVSLPAQPEATAENAEDAGGLQIGTSLRAIRELCFGRIGRCTALPAELVRLPSETRGRVLEVEFDDGERATLPRANVELIKQ